MKKYGAATVDRGGVLILDYGERVARQAIAAMPDGEWSVESAMDNDGISQDMRAAQRHHPDHLVMRLQRIPRARRPADRRWCAISVDSIGGAPGDEDDHGVPTTTANEGFFRPLKVVRAGRLDLQSEAPAVFLLLAGPHDHGRVAVRDRRKDRSGRVLVARSGGDLGGVMFSGLHADGTFFAGGADESSQGRVRSRTAKTH